MSETPTTLRPLEILRTPDEIAPSVAARWKSAYCKVGVTGEHWGSTITGSAKTTYEALMALGDKITAADVERIIGNDTWTQDGHCYECHDAAIYRLGDAPDHETSTFDLCRPCAKAWAERLTALTADLLLPPVVRKATQDGER